MARSMLISRSTATTICFRGGQYMDLDPIPASGGRWLFKDNLFDKTAFFFYTPPGQPGWAGPIDHDYNAYWQRLTSELQSSQTARLTPNNSDGGIDAVNDRLLSFAPVYQAGPLGEFYLPTSSELYSTSPNPEKRGSRSVADAGLY